MLTLDDIKTFNVRFGCGYDISIDLNNGKKLRWLQPEEVNTIIKNVAKEKIQADKYIRDNNLLNHFFEGKSVSIEESNAALNQVFQRSNPS